MMRSYRVLGVVCLLMSLPLAFGQTDRSTITGTVLDPAGAVVPNAAIEAKNSATGALFQGGSSATGNFVFSVPTGTYELTVTVTGFKKYVRQGIGVPVATTVRQDVTLEVGATTETITVVDTTPLLKTESGELSHNVTYERANNLPVLTLGASTGLGNIRNPLQVITLLPGAQFSNDNILRINGMPSNSQSVRIEGQDATNGLWRQQNQESQAGLEAIQEVSVQTSNYAAEYGQAGGGYFNYTMKSGTNAYHGSAYDYIVTESLHAGTPFTTDGFGNHLRNKQRRQDYGFTFGGPVNFGKLYDGHDKSFFFFNFEQFRENQTISTGLATVPTALYRIGDFSGALGPQLSAAGVPAVDPLGRPVFQNAVYDPKTTTVVNGISVRTMYTGNRIPLADLDPVALKIQALFPQPRGTFATSATNNYSVPAYNNFRHTTIPSIKLDHSLSSSIKISGYFGRTRTYSPGNTGFQDLPFSDATPGDDTSTTTRVNYDQTITPTVLLHFGAGLLYTNRTVIPQQNNFDPNLIGIVGYYSTLFPAMAGMNNFQYGGVAVANNPFSSGIGVGRFGGYILKDVKPTANASLTWVKNNHTMKYGGEMTLEGFPQQNFGLTNGSYGFSSQQTATPWQNGQPLNGSTGFEYASFLLGRTSNIQISPINYTRLGNHSFGFFAQDNWKVTRKFTLDYGLRYDYATVLSEQYGRMQNAAFNTLNPTVGRNGAVIYEGDGPGRCKCRFNDAYKLSFGPRLGAAYQLNEKTVLRAGFGLNYGTSANNAFLSLSVADFFTANPSGYAESAPLLRDGNPYRPGNPFGNPTLVWPDFNIGKYPFPTANGLTPQNPFISIDRDAGKLPRIAQWSVSLQREVAKNLVIEAAYVGNRGAYWSAPTLADINYNSLRPQDLQTRFGLDFSDPAVRSLLTTPMSSPLVAARGLNRPAYAGFPLSQPLIQALVPYPQWGNGSGPSGAPPFLGPPLGRTWYDSLQLKAIKRYANGLDFQGAFTWQHEMSLGSNSDTSYFTAGQNRINDVFNRNANKQLSGLSQPLTFVFSYNYTIPAMAANGMAMRTLSYITRDWTIGGVLRYQTGQILVSPSSNNQILAQLGRSFTNNPAVWGGATSLYNRVSGQPLFAQDPNCGCIDPTKQLVLNGKAWTDAPAGQFGVSSAYYNDFRWQRQPAESMAFGRIFRMGPENKYALQVRAEFQNVFNRLFLSAPSTTNPDLPVSANALGQYTGGYGYVNTFNGGGAQPRRGQIVARFTF
ncbi:MAG: TonB-dependent receptor [Acidobacteriota bacterium]